MRLTTYTDYSLRVLIYLGIKHELGRQDLSTISEISRAYDISENHLMKAVYNLAQTPWVESIRGRSGGIRLRQPPAKIVIGDVVRTTEENFYMAECFDKANNQCAITATCQLKHLLSEALNAYLTKLDSATLLDLLPKAVATGRSLGLQQLLSARIPITKIIYPPTKRRATKPPLSPTPTKAKRRLRPVS
jgi:Rrf2 family transcriptional regulator, nitric oxide-sensitive transcriptional repressor